VVSEQAVSTIDPATLYLLSDPLTHEQQSLPSFSIGCDGANLKVNPSIPYDISALRAAQASSYCLAVRLLSPPAAADERVSYPWSSPQSLLRTVEWFKIAFPRHLPRDDVQKLVTMLHTAANKAVGLFAAELRSALANNRVIHGNTYGLALPPTISNIPFESLLITPPPVSFKDDTFEYFSPCHLPVMAHPTFFTESEWTGYFNHAGEWGVGATRNSDYINHFDGIGGDNMEAQANDCDHPNISYPFLVERTVRFRLVNWMTDDIFLLQSNHFQSQSSTHSLQMTVNRQTGTIEIVHGSTRARQEICHAVITPFGIVEGCAPGGVWLWLWKIEWCGQSYNFNNYERGKGSCI
jgi:hypothetical protein